MRFPSDLLNIHWSWEPNTMCTKFYKFALLQFSNYTGVNFSTTRASLLHFCVYFKEKICIWVFSTLSAAKPNFKNLINHSLIQFSDSEDRIVSVTVVAVSNHTVNKESVIIKFEKFTQEGCGRHWGSTGGQCCNDVLLATGFKTFTYTTVWNYPMWS